MSIDAFVMDYLYSSDRESALKRLHWLEQIEDTSTFELLENIGVSTGWKCLEIGAGAGSVAQWLANQVGLTGHIVASELDTELLHDLTAENTSVICHDLAKEDLPQATFNLVHARHVLIHMNGDVTDLIQKMVRALRSGGWLLLEESDLSTSDGGDRISDGVKNLYRHVLNEIHKLYQDRGMDLCFGAKLPGEMRKAGLVDIQSSYKRRIVFGGDAEAQFHKMTFSMLRDQVVNGGGVSSSDFDKFLELHGDPIFSYKTRTTVATWGRCDSAAA